MTKPISLAELRARLHALLRRAERNKSPRVQSLTIGDLRLDPRMRRAWLYKQELKLTPKEFELLAYLMRNRGVVVSRDQLLRDVWGGRVKPRSQTLEVHIRWLRQKVEPNPDRPIFIQTVRMIGYRFEDPGANDRQ
jgi:DNA-binding response OmpR family regulator